MAPRGASPVCAGCTTLGDDITGRNMKETWCWKPRRFVARDLCSAPAWSKVGTCVGSPFVLRLGLADARLAWPADIQRSGASLRHTDPRRRRIARRPDPRPRTLARTAWLRAAEPVVALVFPI